MSDPLAGLPPGIDPYKTLQVDPEADPDVVQAAYRRLAQKFHPDLAAGPESAARMVAINMAWEVVRDPARRAAYDRARAAVAQRRGGLGPVGPSKTSPGTPGASSGRAGSTTAAGEAARSGPPPAESVSRDWTAGRSSVGGGYDPQTMRAPQGEGSAGPPPGNPSGSVLSFGRYRGWTLGEIARSDLEYIEWLDRAPIARAYGDEIDAILRRTGRRRSVDPASTDRRGLFRRR